MDSKSSLSPDNELVKKKIVAIILSGGTGDRLGANIPKQFLSMNGRPILWHTINKFVSHPQITETIIVSHVSWIDETKALFPSLRVVEGGATRQISSRKGIDACPPDTDYVLIHDAVRPLVSHNILDRCIEALMDGHVAVSTVITSSDTIIEVEGYKLSGMPDRSKLRRSQTPQAFRYDVIRTSHEQTKAVNYTDDVRPVFDMGYPCVAVDGDILNMKVTTIADLYSIERLSQLVRPKILDDFDFSERTAIVFGGTSGIGKETANLLEAHGANVIKCGHKECDIRDPQAVENLFKTHSDLSILVNSAGILISEQIANLTPEIIDNIIATNLVGPINTCRIATRYMIEGGHIVNVGSSSAYRGRAGYAIYSASKAALVNFSQAAAVEFARFGICVNVVSPPRTNTRLYRNVNPDVDPSTLFNPKDAARVICSYCTGSETGSIVDLKFHLSDYGIGPDIP